jgi:hypothetical protein
VVLHWAYLGLVRPGIDLGGLTLGLPWSYSTLVLTDLSLVCLGQKLGANMFLGRSVLGPAFWSEAGWLGGKSTAYAAAWPVGAAT